MKRRIPKATYLDWDILTKNNEPTPTQNIFGEKTPNGKTVRFTVDGWSSTLREDWECHKIRKHNIPEGNLKQMIFTPKKTAYQDSMTIMNYRKTLNLDQNLFFQREFSAAKNAIIVTSILSV